MRHSNKERDNVAESQPGSNTVLYRNCMSYPYNNTNFNVRTTDIFKMFKLWKLLYILKANRIAMIQFNFNCLFQTHADTC